MKRSISAVVAVVLGVVLAPQALAATSIQGGPLTGLSFDAPTKIHLAITNYPSAHGIYVLEAVKPAAGARPTMTNAATQLWLSADTSGGATSIKGDVVLTVDNGHSWGADCAHQECGIFIRLDHTATMDTSEDQFIPLTFVASTAAATPTATPTAAALPADTLAVTINGVAVVANVPGAIQYRTPVTFAVTTGSGVAATLKSYTPDLCPVTGFTVDALKGSGQCDIAVIAPGDATHAAKTSHFPFIVGLGVQTLTERVSKVSIKVPATLTVATNFGESVAYKSSTPKNCSVKGATVKGLKVGTCNLVATAMGVNGNYNAITQKVVVTVTK
jgi:hypothetical protein